jgi:hypothetical protein
MYAPSVSPCVDFVVTASPCPVSIGVFIAGGDGMPLAGTTNDWLVLFDVHACQDVTDLKVQGGTPGWETSTTIAATGHMNPSVGTATVTPNTNNNSDNSSGNNNNNNNNDFKQVITWIMDDLGGDGHATLAINISATIPRGITPFTILDLLGNFSLVYKLADGVQQKTSLAGTVTVQVMPPLESPMSSNAQ